MRDRESSQAEKGVGAPEGEVCAHDVAAPVPHFCTEQVAVKQGCEFCAVGDPNKRPDSVLNATSTLLGDGTSADLSPKVFLPFSSESLVFHRSCGRKKEMIIKFKRWKEQKGNVTFFLFSQGRLISCLHYLFQEQLLLHPCPCLSSESHLTLEFKLRDRAASWEYFKS